MEDCESWTIQTLIDFGLESDQMNDFRAFLESMLCVENLDCYLDLVEWQQMEGDQKIERLDYLWNRYWKMNARRQVNLDGLLRKKLQKAIADKDVDNRVFSRAMKKTRLLLEMDSLRKYKEHKATILSDSEE
eukprot:TRINITY_DN4579_c0_g1_i2.p1 TRINITY_DN4579_c0_g1~~TRINITY_DN4579_c0_g1_i2.p1  ORF type:complete len:132 (+),score=35.98 TRINITY_DN4579_c0_g1_i2:23-418(+)